MGEPHYEYCYNSCDCVFHSEFTNSYVYDQPQPSNILWTCYYESVHDSCFPPDWSTNCLVDVDTCLTAFGVGPFFSALRSTTETYTNTCQGNSNSYTAYTRACILTHEYTTAMMVAYATNDLVLISDWAGLDWGRRWWRTDCREEPVAASLPADKIYAARLLDEDQEWLRLQALHCRWTVPTIAGVVHKLSWWEEFTPGDTNQLAVVAERSANILGTGATEYSEFDVPLPQMEGTTRPIPIDDVLKVDLGIDVDDDGDVDDTDEQKEESPGAIIFENWDNDDDDANFQPDKGESSVTGENDLVPIYPKLEPTMNTGTLKLEATAGGSRVKIWTTSTKGTEITLPKTWDLATETVPATLYLEGYDESTSANDIELKLGYANSGSSICDDKLKVTVVRQNLGVASYRSLPTIIIVLLGGDYNHTALVTGYTGKRTKVDLTNDVNWVIIEMDGTSCVQNTLLAHKAVASPFYGFYSIDGLPDYQRNNIVSNAQRCLAMGTIGYTTAAIEGIGVSWDGSFQDIERLRCDGLVEVCYELADCEVWGRTGTHYLIQDFTEEHNYLGMDDPQTQLCPIVQRGGVTNSPTRFIPTVLFQPQSLP